MIQFDDHIFQMGWLKPPTSKCFFPRIFEAFFTVCNGMQEWQTLAVDFLPGIIPHHWVWSKVIFYIFFGVWRFGSMTLDVCVLQITLPETNSQSTWKSMVGSDEHSFWGLRPIFRGVHSLLVSRSVCPENYLWWHHLQRYLAGTTSTKGTPPFGRVEKASSRHPTSQPPVIFSPNSVVTLGLKRVSSVNFRTFLPLQLLRCSFFVVILVLFGVLQCSWPVFLQ